MDARLIVSLGALGLLAACNSTSAADDARPLAAQIPDAVIVTTNEPFQSAEVSASGIRLITPDQPAGRPFAIQTTTATRSGAAARRSWGGQAGGDDLRVEVTDTPCTDSMAGARFPLSGSIELNGVHTAGCARPIAAPPPAVP